MTVKSTENAAIACIFGALAMAPAALLSTDPKIQTLAGVTSLLFLAGARYNARQARLAPVPTRRP